MDLYYPNEQIYTPERMRELTGDGTKVFAGGEMRYLSRQVPRGRAPLFCSTFEDAGLVIIPQDKRAAIFEAQLKNKGRASDYCSFPAYDQNGTNYCWSDGTVQSFTIMRLMMGLPLSIISAASVGGPITGYRNVGGWEHDAADYLTEHGGVDVKYWPNNAINRSYFDKPEVVANRKHHKGILRVDCGNNWDKWATCAALGFVGAFALNSMSHVMAFCDIVNDYKREYRARNSWANTWGAKNDLGFGGFAVFNHGPDSGFMWKQVTLSFE